MTESLLTEDEVRAALPHQIRELGLGERVTILRNVTTGEITLRAQCRRLSGSPDLRATLGWSGRKQFQWLLEVRVSSASDLGECGR